MILGVSCEATGRLGIVSMSSRCLLSWVKLRANTHHNTVKLSWIKMYFIGSNSAFWDFHGLSRKFWWGDIETWGKTSTCKLWRPVVLWWPVLLGPVHHAWSGRTWHLSRVIYVCVCQAWSEFQQMVFRMWSRDLWPLGAVSSVSISVDIYWYLLISIDIYWIYESIRCDDNFGAEDNFLLIPYTTEVVSGAKDPRRNLRKTHHVRMHRTPWASAHPMQIRVSTHLIHSCHMWRGHSLARAVY